MPLRSLPTIPPEPTIPLYTAARSKMLEGIWCANRAGIADTIAPLSYPSKMDCPAWGIEAARCHVGTRLREVPGSTCAGCYALKGTFMAKNVVRKLRAAYEGLFDPRWTPAMIAQVHWHAKERFRWFHSGDLQSVTLLRNIIRVCLETPDVLHWLPTREAETVRACADEIPDNLRVRLSAPMVDGPAPKGWPYTSTVVSDPKRATCPTSLKGGNCADHGCTGCWGPEANKAYLHLVIGMRKGLFRTFDDVPPCIPPPGRSLDP